MLAILGRAKGHDHQAACGPSRLGAYAVRLCAFAHWRSCRWRDRTCGHRSPLVQRTSLLSLRLGMASSPLRGMVYAVRLWSPILGRRRLDQAQDHVRIAFARPPHRAEPIRERVLKPDQALARSLGAASTSTLPTGSVAQIASKAAVVMEMRIMRRLARPYRERRTAHG
jgi:hypothetical protein